MFQSKVFRRLFFTYIMVIFTCMALYTSFLVFENHQIGKMQTQRKSEIQLDELSSILEQRILSAQNIVQNLSYSAAMKQLYMSTKTGAALDSYTLSSIQSELRNTMASGGLSIYQTILFVDGSRKAYSSGGVIALPEEYKPLGRELPCMLTGTVNDIFQLNITKRYAFNKDFLLYCDTYTYQNGSDAGTVCILFDIKDIENNINGILEAGYGVRILYQDQCLLAEGEGTGAVYQKESARMPGVIYEVCISPAVSAGTDRYFFFIMLLIVAVTVLFVIVAYWESKRFYMPINHLEQMVPMETDPSQDEMEKIIHEIQNLIGEKNRYREKMLTITPYARTGMLHSMIIGSVEADKVSLFLDENYLDLIKPYFIVSVVNFACEGGARLPKEEYEQKLKTTIETVVETFSTDELQIVYYFKDDCDVFLILNFETEQKQDDLFFQIHRQISTLTARDFCYVTMGVDTLREDIGELKQACEGAVKALDGILTNGRGAVYFLEDMSGKTDRYYFPADFREKLKRCLLKKEKDGIHELLFDIYKTNLDMAGSPEMYRALIDELHLSVIKTLREVTELNTVHINIEKYRELATLQDIFDYYDAALLSVIDAFNDHERQAGADSMVEEDIVSYIDAHYCDADLSLQKLKDQFNVSNKYLSILCKERFGVTYLQYIQTKRISKAVELLKEKRYSLTEISAMCGYANQLTFRRNFKSIVGENPSDYQEKLN